MPHIMDVDRMSASDGGQEGEIATPAVALRAVAACLEALLEEIHGPSRRALRQQLNEAIRLIGRLRAAETESN